MVTVLLTTGVQDDEAEEDRGYLPAALQEPVELVAYPRIGEVIADAASGTGWLVRMVFWHVGEPIPRLVVEVVTPTVGL